MKNVFYLFIVLLALFIQYNTGYGQVWTEDWESGIGDWSVSNGTWEVGVPTTGPVAAYSGQNCVATKLTGNYSKNVDSRFISPPFTVPDSNENPRLRFWHWFEFYDGNSSV